MIPSYCKLINQKQFPMLHPTTDTKHLWKHTGFSDAACCLGQRRAARVDAAFVPSVNTGNTGSSKRLKKQSVMTHVLTFMQQPPPKGHLFVTTDNHRYKNTRTHKRRRVTEVTDEFYGT